MKNLMNRNFYANSIQEEILCQRIEEIKNSNEIQKFAQRLENKVKDKAEIFNYRIKEPFSALRTYRLANYNKAEQMHDLLGFLIVVDEESEIENIEKIVKEQLKGNNIEIYNLLNEKKFETKFYNKIEDDVKENQYNKLIFDDINTWLEIPRDLKTLLPPFSYNILCKKKFEDVNSEVPIEIRIQTKEDFITTESYYYTIHKNDNIELNLKVPLLCMCFRILRRMANIAFENNEKIKEKNMLELKKIQDENINFMEAYKDKLDYVFLEFNQILNCWKNKLPIYQFNRFK